MSDQEGRPWDDILEERLSSAPPGGPAAATPGSAAQRGAGTPDEWHTRGQEGPAPEAYESISNLASRELSEFRDFLRRRHRRRSSFAGALLAAIVIVGVGVYVVSEVKWESRQPRKPPVMVPPSPLVHRVKLDPPPRPEKRRAPPADEPGGKAPGPHG